MPQHPHIGIFGRRNFGKSSLINALVGQEVAIVASKPGTTTDPVSKTFELTGLGPVVLIDTAGIDDEEMEIGAKRVEKTLATLKKIDLALLVVVNNELGDEEKKLLDLFEDEALPYIIVHNKADMASLTQDFSDKVLLNYKAKPIGVSAVSKVNIEQLHHEIRTKLRLNVSVNDSMLGDLVSHGDLVLLVTPIDIEAPAGRLILPQVQAIRDCLDNDCLIVVCKERELDIYWKKIGVKPNLVVTDSQVFLKADAGIPKDIPLTSFSILLARLKGDFPSYMQGTKTIDKLKNEDKILILESCSHHVAGDDIGRVKIPRWLTNYTGKKLAFTVVAGLDKVPEPITNYSLVIQCGGCMLTRRQLKARLQPALAAKVPVTNYGMTIAWCMGIYARAIAPFCSEFTEVEQEALMAESYL